MNEHQSLVYRLIENQYAFAFWREPGNNKIKDIYLPDDKLQSFTNLDELSGKDGFVFVPFEINDKNRIYFFNKEHKSFQLNSDINNKQLIKNLEFGCIENSKKVYENKIQQILSGLNTLNIQKAVLSGTHCMCDYNYKIAPALFECLCDEYPEAFVYHVFIPGKGYWVGASPEVLYKSKSSMATTVSLAATQAVTSDSSKIYWNQKEFHEQELVSQHVRGVLKNFVQGKISELGPNTFNVGRLFHLRTIFQFDSKWVNSQLGTFLSALHPTPAVCGLPVDKSRMLIKEVEGYDREYYTGFLGSVSTNNDSCLYVNLRCMQAFENGIALYAGGGITSESVPELEWNEWQLKIQSLLQIIEKLNIH